ncbi:MAG: hypothetical protein ABSG54_08385 [Terriglobia bacterium]|jgi:hypothetical protein
MLTTNPDSVTFLIEWLYGPRRKPYQKWLGDLHRRFNLHPRERRAQLASKADQDADARQRVEALLSDLKELAGLGESNWAPFKRLGEQINRNLARYRYTPLLILDRPVIWKTKSGTRTGPPFKPAPTLAAYALGGVFQWTVAPFRGEIPAQELYALRILESIVRNRWLDTIRRCEQCSRWFIAAKPWAKRCGSPVCREQAKRAYQSSETYKAKRRKTPN